MEIKDVEVTCPCCGTRLTVDVRTRKLLRSRPPKEVDASGKPKVGKKDWDQITSKVEGRLSEATDRFESSLAKEKTREEDLEDLFRRAAEKAKRHGERDEED